MSTGLATKPASQTLEQETFDYGGLEDISALDRVEALKDDEQAAIRDSFEQLADELEESAAALSSTRRAIRDPAFVEILALGSSVVPDVITRLETSSNRPLWLRLLGTFTSFPPGLGQATIDEAADAWIAWGRLNP